MINSKKTKNTERLYTAHGAKMAQGIPSVINGQKALASFKGDKIVGYTTLEEINKEFYVREDLPEYKLSF